MTLAHKTKLRKGTVIESVNGILALAASVFDLEYTRHISLFYAMAHMMSALIAYCFYDNKPAVFLPNQKQLLVA